MSDYENLSDTLAREIQAFQSGEPTRRRAAPISRPAEGVTVRLAVRRHRLAPDEIWEHQSSGISRLQAKVEAEQQARQAGYQVGHVIDYQGGTA